MISFIPTLVLASIAGAGALARFWTWNRFPKRAETAAFGGYAFGLLCVWLASCLIRGFFVFLITAGTPWYAVLVWSIPLFFAESMVLVFALGLQLWQLGGNYSAESEWEPSVFDGARFAIRYVAIVSVIAFPLWWLMAPGEYGMFEGSIADPIVTQSAMAPFTHSTPTTDLQTIRNLQNTAAIPHALAIAAIVAPLFSLILPGKRWAKRELGRDYLHVHIDSPDSQEAGPLQQLFRPRGGGRN